MTKVHKPSFQAAIWTAAGALASIVVSTSLAQDIRSSELGRATTLAAASAVGQPQTPPVLNPQHPDTYVVVPGDTLWDIAAMFLRDPWYWPEIWQINPQIANPHLIYPGDVLSLAFLDDGRPAVIREGGPGNTVRLSPRVRVQPLEEAIPTIPYATLRAFLSRSSLLAESELESLPYIVAQRESLIGAAGNDVYVRGIDGDAGTPYNVVHLGEPLVDPDDNTVLGYEGIFVGEGSLRRTGDPSTLRLVATTREALIGDFIVSPEMSLPANFLPRAPEANVDGRIISVVDGISLIGQYQVVVLNRGARHGIEPGHVLRAFRAGEEIVDRVRGREKVQLPDEPAGTIMVFRSFDRMSYALVMEATSELHVLDKIANP
jgi:LysM repeat protein